MADVDSELLLSPVLRRSNESHRASPGGRLPSGWVDVTFSLEPPPCGEEEEEERPRHRRDACGLCRRPLRADAEVYMYRGDAPFCSAECRQEQMELDEARELETRFRRRRRQHQYRNTAAPENLRVPPAGTVVAS